MVTGHVISFGSLAVRIISILGRIPEPLDSTAIVFAVVSAVSMFKEIVDIEVHWATGIFTHPAPGD